MEVAPDTVTNSGDMVDANGLPASDSTDTLGMQGASGSRSAAGGGQGTRGGSMMTAGQFDADSYNMSHKRRGMAIIFNNKKFDPSTNMNERTGTDTDAANMYTVLSDMGFKIELVDNCTASHMESALVKAARMNHSDADCFACVILSHGEEGYVYGTDRPIEITKLVDPFKGNRCKTLAGKPKLFFIQACRGSQLDEGVDVTDSKGARGEEDIDTDIVVRRIPTEADFLLAYSVVPGYYSWRNSTDGSWFVQALFRVFRDNWQRMDLLTMLTRVNKQVAFDFESNASRQFMRRKKQIPCITSMLTKDLFFAPQQQQ